jgi:metal-responsive CopG/Arc/MetJ family transcriptional regulator
MKHNKKNISSQELARLDALVRSRSPQRPASISVSGSLLEAVDRVAGPAQRSAFIERALRRRLQRILRAQRNEVELAILNAKATRLNAESAAALADQASLDNE